MFIIGLLSGIIVSLIVMVIVTIKEMIDIEQIRREKDDFLYPMTKEAKKHKEKVDSSSLKS